MAATYLITSGISNIYLLLIIRIVVAAAIYLLITWLTGAKILRESLDYLRKKKWQAEKTDGDRKVLN